MKKLTLLVLAAGAVLALAATAQAKEIVALKVCGASSCNEIRQPVALGGDYGTFTGAPPGPYYTVDIGFREGENVIHHETGFWLPKSNLIRFDEREASWWTPTSSAPLRDAVSGLEAFVPGLSRVTVGGKVAADPSSYLALLGDLRYAVLPKAKLHLTRIVLRATEKNPWVDGAAALGYDAKRRLLVRPDGYYKLPAALGKLVMTRASLSSKASAGSGGGVDGALLAGIGVGAIAAIGVLGLAKLKKMT